MFVVKYLQPGRRQVAANKLQVETTEMCASSWPLPHFLHKLDLDMVSMAIHERQWAPLLRMRIWRL